MCIRDRFKKDYIKKCLSLIRWISYVTNKYYISSYKLYKLKEIKTLLSKEDEVLKSPNKPDVICLNLNCVLIFIPFNLK